MENKFNEAISFLPDSIKIALNGLPENIKKSVTEIRLRANRPLILHSSNEVYYIDCSGNISDLNNKNLLYCDEKIISEAIFNACNKSIYAHLEDFKNGFLTIKGGHRIGFCGVYCYDNGCIANQREISSLNIRIAHSVYGCSKELLFLFDKSLNNVILCGPPMSGKTTFLRDLAKNLSDNSSFYNKIVIIDERGEIASCYKGIPQNDVGINTDVISYCKKSDGITNAVRSLSPDIIICDEIGSTDDVNSLVLCSTCGVKVVSTIHCGNEVELKSKKIFNDLIYHFNYFVFLDGKGKFSKIRKILSREELCR